MRTIVEQLIARREKRRRRLEAARSARRGGKGPPAEVEARLLAEVGSLLRQSVSREIETGLGHFREELLRSIEAEVARLAASLPEAEPQEQLTEFCLDPDEIDRLLDQIFPEQPALEPRGVKARRRRRGSAGE